MQLKNKTRRVIRVQQTTKSAPELDFGCSVQHRQAGRFSSHSQRLLAKKNGFTSKKRLQGALPGKHHKLPLIFTHVNLIYSSFKQCPSKQIKFVRGEFNPTRSKDFRSCLSWFDYVLAYGRLQ